jgi:hypothetical protein
LEGSGATRLEADLSIKRGEILMRRASTFLAVLGLSVLGLAGMAGSASAAPTVTIKAEPVPIPGFPGTGNILGAGSALQAEFTISGTEYGGYPPPLIGVNVFFPKGTKLHPSGFPTCSPAIIEQQKEPAKCPKASKAGPVGEANGFVVFGTERVPETVTLESFYVPGGGVDFFAAGHTPTLIEVVSKGHFVNYTGSGAWGPEFETQVPLVETVPGAPDASVASIKVKTGSAIKKGKETIYYGRVPKTCKGKLPIKAELKFAGLGGLPEQTVTAEYKAPCPRK